MTLKEKSQETVQEPKEVGGNTPTFLYVKTPRLSGGSIKLKRCIENINSFQYNKFATDRSRFIMKGEHLK